LHTMRSKATETEQSASKPASTGSAISSGIGSTARVRTDEEEIPKLEWIKQLGVHHVFLALHPEEKKGEEKRTKFELTTRGCVSKRFLGKAKYKHSVNLKVDEKEIKRIEAIFKTSPDFKEDGFKYPIIGKNELRLVAPKDAVTNDDGEFDAVWDAQSVSKGGMPLPDVDEREPLPVTMIEEEAKIVVELTVGTWKWERGTNKGGRLDLLSIGLLEEANIGVDFGSPRKKRKTTKS